MSLNAEIRTLADSHFQTESRSKGIAFGLALTLGIKVANEAQLVEGTTPQQQYIQNGMGQVAEAISTINEMVLLDIRFATILAKQIYLMIISIRTSPIQLDPKNNNIFGALFDTEGFLNEEEIQFYETHRAGIFAIYNVMSNHLNPDNNGL